MNKMNFKHIFTYWIRIQLFWENENKMTLLLLGKCPRFHGKMFQTNLGSYNQPQENDTLPVHNKRVFFLEYKLQFWL